MRGEARKSRARQKVQNLLMEAMPKFRRVGGVNASYGTGDSGFRHKNEHRRSGLAMMEMLIQL